MGIVLICGCARQKTLPVSHPAAASFYVATNGNDGWSGTLPSPNGRKTDGPFATPQRALQATRKINPGQALDRGPMTVWLRNGAYFLTEPLTLQPEDSNLTIGAYRHEHPILSGGRTISGWKEVVINDKKLWAAEIPEARAGSWFFHELWINGARATRARHPNHGYLHIASLPDATPEWTQGHTRFTFREGDIKPWPSVTNAEVIAMTRWVESRLPVLSVDTTNRIVSFGKKSVFQLAPEDPYYLENAFEFLDEPGEWYLDQTAGTLYYLPKPDETLGKIEAIAPVLQQIVRLEGAPEASNFISKVSFRGVTFAHAEWYFPPTLKAARENRIKNLCLQSNRAGSSKPRSGSWRQCGARGCAVVLSRIAPFCSLARTHWNWRRVAAATAFRIVNFRFGGRRHQDWRAY